MRISKKYIGIFLITILICLLVLQTLIISAPFYYKPVKSDAILILGYALEDGKSPDGWLQYRLEKGLELYNKNFADNIIVSGGKGIKDKIAVASAMKTWLIERGVPQEKILLEDKSGTTLENIKFSKEIMTKHGIKSVIVVTSNFHLFRAMLMAKSRLEHCSGAPAYSNNVPKRIFFYFRENFALLKYLFLANG